MLFNLFTTYLTSVNVLYFLFLLIEIILFNIIMIHSEKYFHLKLYSFRVKPKSIIINFTSLQLLHFIMSMMVFTL